MFKRSLILVVVLVCLVGAVEAASAQTARPAQLSAGKVSAQAVDSFMWLFIPAVQGESTDFAHKNWIDLQSWSWGAPNASLLGTTTGGVVNKGDGSGPTVSNLVITKSIDKATPLLMLACCAGAHYKTVLLAVRKAGGTQDYLHITLTDVFLTSFNVGMTGGGTGEENPTESVTLNFTKVEFAYAPPTGGVIDTFWNLGTAQGPAGTVP